MKRKLLFCLLFAAVIMLVPSVALANSNVGGVVTIDTPWAGTLQTDVEALTGINGPTDVIELHITATDSLDSTDLTYIQSMSNLTILNVADSVTVGDVGDGFFSDNDIIEEVTFPATSFGYNAFYSCGNLSYVSLPSATSFNFEAFSNCDALVNIELLEVLTFNG